jgi:hypothetical protein
MTAFALSQSQVRYANKAFWRNPARAYFTFAFQQVCDSSAVLRMSAPVTLVRVRKGPCSLSNPITSGLYLW